MKSTDALMFVAVVAVLLATVNLIMTVNKIGDFKVLSGFMTDTGRANLTITSNANVNFTTENITWGTGYVGLGDSSCELTTTGIMNCSGFNTISTGLVLENIGNVNVGLNLTSSKNAANFIGTGAVFEWNTTQIGGTSCPSGLNITDWTTVTTASTEACGNFTYDGVLGADEIEVDLRVVIPSTGINPEAKGVTITATADVNS